VPVSFRYNPDLDTIDVGGHDFAQRKKYRDVRAHPRPQRQLELRTGDN
jgi:pyridoxamine 5'-phosphate oxidase family protein